MTDRLLQTAVEHHQSGRLAMAESLYRQVLAQNPHQPDALHLLGLIASQSGRHDAAIPLIRRAIQISPGIAPYFSNLGEAYRASHRLDEALAAHQQAIALDRNNAEIHYNFATTLSARREFDQAVAEYNLAIHLKPDHQQAFNNLGIALRARGQLDAAIEAFATAVRLNPALAGPLANLGMALSLRGDHDRAIDALRQSLARDPAIPETHNSLGLALAARQEFDEATAAFGQALLLRPAYAEAHYNLGNTCLIRNQFDEAAAAYRRALAIDPTSTEALTNLGSVLRQLGKMDDAIECYRQAIALQPTLSEPHNNLGVALFLTGLLDEALNCYSTAMSLSPKDPGFHSPFLYALHFHPGHDSASILDKQLEWDRRHGQYDAPKHLNDRSGERRLRIGYVSPDFRDHVVGLNLIPLFRARDRDKFEAFCYSDVARPDSVTAYLRSQSDQWREVAGRDHQHVARQIRDDRIDILVDLTLHMAFNRLPVFAMKPAPVLVTFAGYPAGTGLRAMDYRLTDPWLDPPGLSDADYVEKSIRLGATFWCFEPPGEAVEGHPNAGPLPALQNGFVTFGCLNAFSKINEPVLMLWARVLHAVANSRLIVLSAQGSHRQTMTDRLSRAGIDPSRIEFVVPRPRAQFLGYYHRIDIGLDTIPYNGHSTSLDSYWMGVPVVTYVGKTAVGRAGLSQLTNLGLPELIARTDEQYVRIAAHLASDLPALAEMRAGLRNRMRTSPLMDARAFARDIEAAYRQMWREWLARAD